MATKGPSRTRTYSSPVALATRLCKIKRGTLKGKNRPKRIRPTADDRREALKKTGGRCHICGGPFSKPKGNANRKKGAGPRHPAVMDHIVSHSSGGDRVDNLLPAHAECNSTRWHFSAEEWRIIMKLGVFARDKIEKLVDREQCHSNGKSKGGLGHEIAKAFIAKEEARIKKQKKK